MFSQFLCGEGNPLFNAGQGASEIDPTPKPDEFAEVREIRDSKYPNGTCELSFSYRLNLSFDLLSAKLTPDAPRLYPFQTYSSLNSA